MLSGIGSEKMVLWDDLDLHHPIKIYDKKIEPTSEIMDSFFVHKTTEISDCVYIPKVRLNHPLQAECEHFIECIEQGISPQSDGFTGLRVVRALEAATASMKNDRKVVSKDVPREDSVIADMQYDLSK